jgi:hypothetical protein
MTMTKEQRILVLVAIVAVAGIAIVVAHPWIGLIAGGILGWSGTKALGRRAWAYTQDKTTAAYTTVKETVSKKDNPTVTENT